MTAEVVELLDPDALLDEILEDAHFVELDSSEHTVEASLAAAILRLHRHLTLGGRAPSAWKP